MVDFQQMWSPKSCYMFSSRLYPLFVRAVSFQTCSRTSLQQCYLHLLNRFISQSRDAYLIHLLNHSQGVNQEELRRKKCISSPSASGALPNVEMNSGEFQLHL
ncbi:hypothetical protein C7R93_20505 [Brevibacillus fortis]|uniref:Uncharacterized protein n=1 Tax=Brevibacillus fortis TaxID=2126352 RepID=A0A2P7UYW5_9BACL|nr:hypothetical protein C7R93_20505 [Brevibacillus fortis]